MTAEGESPSRTTVQVTVPEWQKVEWEEHAADLDMSLSEFFRSMVQAGRNGFVDDQSSEPKDTDRTMSFQGEVLAEIEEHGPITWEELVTAFTSGVESRTEAALESLQTGGRVIYSGPKNGYITTDQE